MTGKHRSPLDDQEEKPPAEVVAFFGGMRLCIGFGCAVLSYILIGTYLAHSSLDVEWFSWFPIIMSVALGVLAALLVKITHVVGFRSAWQQRSLWREIRLIDTVDENTKDQESGHDSR